MNYRAVLKTYTALRQLTDEESALLTTLRNMSENDQQLMIETLSPQSKSAKKPGKKSATKSRKAASLQQQLRGTSAPLDGGVSKMRCAAPNCGEYADHNVHHLNTDSDYHEFISSESAVAASGD